MHFQGRQCFQICSCLPSKQRSTLKDKNFLPMRAKYFLFKLDPFHKGTNVQESKQEVIQVVFLVKMAKFPASVSSNHYEAGLHIYVLERAVTNIQSLYTSYVLERTLTNIQSW